MSVKKAKQTRKKKNIYIYAYIATFTRAELLSHVRLLLTPQTVPYPAPLSMEFPRQESWSGLPFPPPGSFSTQASNRHLLQLLGRQILYH